MPEALEMIRHFEGYYDQAYQCPAGIWTIGIGTTAYPNGSPVKQGDTCTITDAEKYLAAELNGICVPAIQRLIKVDLNSKQFSALCSLVYNIGQGNFERSTLRKLLNEKAYSNAALEFLRWNKAGGKQLPGLTRRRKAECAMFQGKDWRAEC